MIFLLQKLRKISEIDDQSRVVLFNSLLDAIAVTRWLGECIKVSENEKEGVESDSGKIEIDPCDQKTRMIIIDRFIQYLFSEARGWSKNYELK